MQRPCSFCGGKDLDALFLAREFDSGKESFWLVRCRQCKLVRTQPALTEQELKQYYSLPYYGSDKAKFFGPAEKVTRFFNYLRARTILSHLREDIEPRTSTPPRILDIGCGRGNLLMSLKRLGCECHGVERNEFPIDDLPRGIEFHTGKLSDIAFDGDSFDAIIIWHVLEHADDPVLQIGEASRILRPGGFLAIAVPNFGSFQAKFFKKDWFHLDLPRHIYHFTPGTLTAILKKFGFSIAHKTTFSVEQNMFGFIQSTLNMMTLSSAPNRFYTLLKKKDKHPSLPAALLWAVLTCFIFPFAVIEHLLSGFSGKGATLIIYSKKAGDSNSVIDK